MSNLPLPKPVQLGPPGLYSLPEAVGFVGPSGAAYQLPVQLHFVLKDGTELDLPMSNIVLGRLYTALKGLFDSDEGGAES
jgi:hypothetical protein